MASDSAVNVTADNYFMRNSKAFLKLLKYFKKNVDGC